MKLFTPAITLVFTTCATAQQWDSGGANNNWSTALNWATDAVPANNGSAAIIFGTGARLTPKRPG